MLPNTLVPVCRKRMGRACPSAALLFRRLADIACMHSTSASRTWGGQKACLILRFTDAASSSMKMAESGMLFDIFSCPCARS